MADKNIISIYKSKVKIKPYSSNREKFIVYGTSRTTSLKLRAKNLNRYYKKVYRNTLKLELLEQLKENK